MVLTVGQEGEQRILPPALLHWLGQHQLWLVSGGTQGTGGFPVLPFQ